MHSADAPVKISGELADAHNKFAALQPRSPVIHPRCEHVRDV